MHSIGELLRGHELVCLTADATALEAARAMQEQHVGSVLVRDTGDCCDGIFTERDLMVRVVVPGLDPATTRLRDVMTSELYVVSPDDRSSVVHGEMTRRHIRHVPVVSDGKVVGMLSLRDLLRADLENARNEVEAITDYVRGGFHQELEDEDGPAAP